MYENGNQSKENILTHFSNESKVGLITLQDFILS